jgi:hypothetical protein
MWWASFFACDLALEEGFEDDVVQGWACELAPYGTTVEPNPVSWYGLDAGESFRIQVYLPSREVTFPDPDASFLVYAGAGLLLFEGDEDRCDDVVSSSLFDRQRIVHRYRATAGRVEVVDADGGLGLRVDGVVLSAADVPDVALDGELPAWAGSALQEL